MIRLIVALLGLFLVLALAVAGPGDPPPFYRDKSQLMVWIDEHGKARPVRSPSYWAKRRAHILANMQIAMGPLPEANQRVPLDVQVSEQVVSEKWTRFKLTYAAEPGDRVPAYLFIPTGASRKARRPAMLCLHQTTRIGKREPAGLGGLPNLPYAKELADRGFVTLAPDYPGYGDYMVTSDGSRPNRPYEMGYVSATMKGIWNHLRAVDLLAGRPEVNPERLGVIGHSLGGHNSLFVAAFDERLKVVVSSCGFNSFPKYYGGVIRPWSHPGYMPRISLFYDADPQRVPFDFTEVVGALAPRAFFANAPIGDSNFAVSGVKDCFAAAAPVYRLLGAGDRLVAAHPNVGHDFPSDVRKQAYEFVEKWIKQGMDA